MKRKRSYSQALSNQIEIKSSILSNSFQIEQNNEEETYFHLPKEIWGLIFSFLDLKTLLICSKVCRGFYLISKKLEIWNLESKKQFLPSKEFEQKTKDNEVWRNYFLKEIKLFSNWQHNDFQFKEFSDCKSPISYITMLDETYMFCSEENIIKQYNVLSEKCVNTFAGHSEKISSFRVNENYLASSSRDKSIKIWNSFKNEGEAKYVRSLIGHQKVITGVRIGKKTLASCSWDTTIKLWDVETGQIIQNFLGHKDWIWNIQYDEETSFLLSGSDDKTLKIWDIKSGKEITTLKGHTGPVSCFQYTDDIIVSGSLDSCILFWDRRKLSVKRLINYSGSIVCMHLMDPHLVIGGDGFVSSVDVSSGEIQTKLISEVVWGIRSDKKKMAFGNGNKIEVWNVSYNKLIGKYGGMEDSSKVTSLYLSSLFLVGGFSNGKIRFYDFVGNSKRKQKETSTTKRKKD